MVHIDEEGGGTTSSRQLLCMWKNFAAARDLHNSNKRHKQQHRDRSTCIRYTRTVATHRHDEKKKEKRKQLQFEFRKMLKDKSPCLAWRAVREGKGQRNDANSSFALQMRTSWSVVYELTTKQAKKSKLVIAASSRRCRCCCRQRLLDIMPPSS